MTTEQKICSILQMGCAVTIYEDCGQMILVVQRRRDEWHDVEFYADDHDGPSVKQLDAMVDRALELVNGGWAKNTANG